MTTQTKIFPKFSTSSKWTLYSVLNIFIITIAQNVGGLHSAGVNSQFQTFQSQTGENITHAINSSVPYILVYNLSTTLFDLNMANIRLETTVEQRFPQIIEIDCPVIFSWRQSRSSKSWALPLEINNDGKSGTGAQLYSAGHTVCLDSVSDWGSSHEMSSKAVVKFFVFVSTCSPVNVTYSILFSVDMSGIAIELDTPVTSIVVSPSITRYYRFDFPAKSDRVIVQVTSDDHICMTAAIQSPWCQLLNSNLDSKRDGPNPNSKTVKFQRTWQDMTTRSVIPVMKSEYPLGFFIGFAVHDNDKECQSYNGVAASNGWLPIQSLVYGNTSSFFASDDSSREKMLNITIQNEIPTEEYLKPILFPVYFVTFIIGLTSLIYGMFSFIAKRRIQNLRSSSSLSDEEDLISEHDDVIDNDMEGSTSTRRSRSQSKTAKKAVVDADVATVQVEGFGRGQISSDPSGLSTSRDSNTSNAFGVPVPPIKHRRVSNSSTDSNNDQEFSPFPTMKTKRNGSNSGSQRPSVRRLSLGQCVDEADIVCIDEDRAWLTMDVFIHKTKKLKQSLNKIHYLIFTVGIFYVLPTIQLLYTYHQIALSTGENDLCYRNYLCSHKMLGWDDFNHIYSNIVYIVTGFTFMVFVSHYQFKVQSIEKAVILESADNLEFSGRGIHPINPRKGNGVIHEFGVFYALGLSLVLEGILSGSYHVCPTQMNFQFDTSFMYILAVLSAIKIYQFRHADPICPHNTFGLLAIIAFISVGGLLLGSKIYEAIFFVLHIFFVIMTSIYMYYVGHVRDDDGNAVTNYSIFKESKIREYIFAQPSSLLSPLKKHRVRMLFVIPFVVLNVSIDIWQIVNQKDFPMYLLYIFAGNMMFYFVYYFFMKAIHGEFFNIQSAQPLIYIFISTILASLGIMYFMDKRYNASLSPAESRVMNQPCMIGQFYDTHDVWHFLSAGAIFFFFMTLLTMDDAILLKPRTKIIAF